jgi:hypothetical protein
MIDSDGVIRSSSRTLVGEYTTAVALALLGKNCACVNIPRSPGTVLADSRDGRLIINL